MPYIKKVVMRGFKSFARETEIPFVNGMNVVVGPNGSGKSARWDTEVLIASGDKKPIGEIVEESLKKSSKIKKIDDGLITTENPLGIKVLSINPNTMKIEESEIRAFMKREGEPNLYTIKTGTGKTVTTTSCHPVMIYKNGRIISEIVENLKEGDFIATPNKIDIEKNIEINIEDLAKEKANSEQFARFIGYIVGDGCIIKNSRIDFVNADLEIIEDYRKVVEFLNYKVSISERKDTIAKNVYLYSRVFSNALIEFFNNNYLKGKKHIPKEIIFGSKSLLKNFLAALFDCNASVRKDNPTFEYVTMSEELANNVIFALLRFGIIARKSIKSRYATNTKEKNRKNYFFITVEGKEKISQLYNQIFMRCVHKRNLLKKWADNSIKPNTSNNLLPLEINQEIKRVFVLSGIKIKPLRKKYPFLIAYIENRCNASIIGLLKLIPLIEEKLSTLISDYQNISRNQIKLIECLNQLNISGQEASKQIGLHKGIIMDTWAKNKFNAKPQNLEKFYFFVKNNLNERILQIKSSLEFLKNLANSDIFWDKIKKIEKVKGEEWVYDLEVENNHNFIANNIFVHNSNVADSVCFVLGRLSIKSMRAAKAANLIFAGTKELKPMGEAMAKIVFENSDKKFSLDSKEIEIERVVRRNGQGIYKINGETKTRQEVLELLASAGIDPYGFNIVLQGEIASLIKIPSEERRKIIEEVAGISIYEVRKEKSLAELEKTDERLKEVSAILRERKAYLRNLDEERKQALKFKELEESSKKYKASIFKRKIDEKSGELKKINSEIERISIAKEKQKLEAERVSSEIRTMETEVDSINSKIQESSGIGQERLNTEISNLKAELAGLNVRKDNSETKLREVLNRRARASEEIKTLEADAQELRKKSPLQFKKTKEIEKKKLLLENLEKEKKNFYHLKEKFSSIKEKINDKDELLKKTKNELSFIIGESERIAKGLSHKDIETCKKSVVEMRKALGETEKDLHEYERKIKNCEKEISVSDSEIARLEELRQKISKLDICPLCKTKITHEHIAHIVEDSNNKINEIKKHHKAIEEELEKLKNRVIETKNKQDSLRKSISGAEIDLIKLDNLEDKKRRIKTLVEEEKAFDSEIKSLSKEKESFERKISEVRNIEGDYERVILEIQELSSVTDENIDSSLEFKEREIEKTKLIIKQSYRDAEDLDYDISELEKNIDNKNNLLEGMEAELQEILRKFEKMIERKDFLQVKIREKSSSLMEIQNKMRELDNSINNFKIDKARTDAELDNLKIDFQPFVTLATINLPMHVLEEKLEKTKQTLETIGSVNLRALEVYDSVKKEYDIIEEKVSTLEKEKLEILNVITEIDKKKRKTFIKTLVEINELFKRNFMQLSTKGQVSLELENQEDPFSAGLDIVVKVGKGKYFDVNSLSGGEKTLVALSLIFAIQEYKPYPFYIFDEVDAALDKRNSEKLALLIKRYMTKGQYIIVTHNDAIITESSVLYGVSMQEGVSKIFSLEV